HTTLCRSNGLLLTRELQLLAMFLEQSTHKFILTRDLERARIGLHDLIEGLHAELMRLPWLHIAIDAIQKAGHSRAFHINLRLRCALGILQEPLGEGWMNGLKTKAQELMRDTMATIINSLHNLDTV